MDEELGGFEIVILRDMTGYAGDPYLPKGSIWKAKAAMFNTSDGKVYLFLRGRSVDVAAKQGVDFEFVPVQKEG